MSKFSVHEFVADPTLQRLKKCRKEDLYSISDHYSFDIEKGLKKQELLKRVIDGLEQAKVIEEGHIVSTSSPKDDAKVEEDSETGGEQAGGGGIGGEVEGELPVSEPPFLGDSLATPPALPGLPTEGRGVPQTLPRYDPEVSVVLPEEQEMMRLKVRLAQLESENLERRLQNDGERYRMKCELDVKLKIRELEIQAERDVKLKQLELEARPAGSSDNGRPNFSSPFVINKHISMVPQFRETEVD